jgi:8-oxo-dGTP pyrophosphatase MutT (NUDIX family)
MENLEDSLKFKIWKEQIEKSALQLENYEQLATVRKKNGEVLFSFLETRVRETENNRYLPGYLMLRGQFVSVLTCLIEEESETSFLVLVSQRRIANGAIFYEHPCGMCDNVSDIYTVALHELAEETGLEIEQSQLVLLNEEPLYTSPGLLDEAGYFFFCELHLSALEIQKLDKRLLGVSSENEHITTRVVRLEEAPALLRNANALLNYYLYLSHKSKPRN